MDTSDTSDTGYISQEDDSFEVISAAELAEESGGFSCQVITVQPDNWAIGFGIILGLIMYKGLR